MTDPGDICYARYWRQGPWPYTEAIRIVNRGGLYTIEVRYPEHPDYISMTSLDDLDYAIKLADSLASTRADKHEISALEMLADSESGYFDLD